MHRRENSYFNPGYPSKQSSWSDFITYAHLSSLALILFPLSVVSVLALNGITVRLRTEDSNSLNSSTEQHKSP